MLILTRKPGELIFIGEGGSLVKVGIVRVRENSVVISVDAPPNVSVDREEIRHRKDAEKTLHVRAP